MDVPSFTFTVTLEPAHMFLESLEAMEAMHAMHSWASLIVYNRGNIKVLTPNQDGTVLALLRMEASAVDSSTIDHGSIQIHLPSWIQSLRPAVLPQMEASIRIYKNDNSPNIFCSVEDDTSPIDLGEATFVLLPSIPNIQIPEDGPSIRLRSECLREVLSAHAYVSDVVAVTFKNDSITWSKTITEELVYLSEDGDYQVDSPGPIRPAVIPLKWQLGSVEALRIASRMTHVVVIDPLSFPTWNSFAFRFLVKEGSHFSITMRQDMI